MITKVLVNKKDGKSFYVKDTDKELHTSYGLITSKELKKKKGIVKTNIGKEFYIFPASFVDRFRRLKRAAQIITPKDAGVIIAETGVNSKSKVVEAGGGSAGLTCMLANIVGKLTTYEIRKPFVKVINENVKNFGFSNVTIKNKDVYLGIAEKNLDLIVLDLLDPKNVLDHAAKSLKPGGFLVVYLPSITQVTTFLKKARKNDFIVMKILETIQRKWKIEGRIARPEFRMLGHTGFLSFLRRV